MNQSDAAVTAEAKEPVAWPVSISSTVNAPSAT